MVNPDLCQNVGETNSPVTNSNAGGIAPQATSTAGIPEPPPQTLSATGSIGPVVSLNPYGPDNRLDQGAILFSYPDLIYDQFIEVQQQFEITDDTEPGTILLQIPYDPLSEYMNPYIRRYATMHGRYNGDILIRCFMIGNATYSGTLMWYWSPTKVNGKIANFYDAQKYAYKTQSVVMPSVEEFVLSDARQYLYYRTTTETDIASRPHLVLAVHTSVVSPLREGIKVRLRIGTRLASGTDIRMGKQCKPFMFADPQIIPFTPTPGAGDINGKTISEVFPNYKIQPLRLLLDGTTTIGAYSYKESDGFMIPFNLDMPVPALAGGVFQDNAMRRLVATDFQQGIVAKDRIRTCFIVHQLPAKLQKDISIQQSFIDCCKGDKWLDNIKSLEFLSSSVKIFVSRVNEAHLSVYKDPKSTFEIVLVCQIACITNFGMLYVFAYDNVVPSNSLEYAAMSGVPNTPQGNSPVIPNNPILGPVSLSTDLINYPSNWVGVKLTERNITIVASPTDIAPSEFSTPILVEYFDALATGVAPEQVIQFDLLDPTARTRVITLRYLPKLHEFVANPMDNIRYRQYPGRTSDLIFGGYGVVPSTTSFPASDTSFWPTRFSNSPVLTTPRFVSIPYRVTANAAIALGAAEVVPEVLESLEGGVNSAAAFLGQGVLLN